MMNDERASALQSKPVLAFINHNSEFTSQVASTLNGHLLYLHHESRRKKGEITQSLTKPILWGLYERGRNREGTEHL